MTNPRVLCRWYYQQVLAKFPNDTEAGFIAGQCEKVMLGACVAAMQRSYFQKAAMQRSYFQKACAIANIYKLQTTFIPGPGMEIWFCRPENVQVVDTVIHMPLNSPEAHVGRAFLTGVPAEEIELDFHLRPKEIAQMGGGDAERELRNNIRSKVGLDE